MSSTEDKFKTIYNVLDRMDKAQSIYSSLTKLFQKQAGLIQAFTEVGEQISANVTRLSTFYDEDLGEVIRDLSNHCCKIDTKLTTWSNSITNDFVEAILISMDSHSRDVQTKLKTTKTSQQLLNKDLGKAEKKISKITKVRHPELSEITEFEKKQQEIEKQKDEILTDVNTFERNQFKFFLGCFVKPFLGQASFARYLEKMKTDISLWKAYSENKSNLPFSRFKDTQNKMDPRRDSKRTKSQKSQGSKNVPVPSLVPDQVLIASPDPKSLKEVWDKNLVNYKQNMETPESDNIIPRTVATQDDAHKKQPEIPRVPAPQTLPPPFFSDKYDFRPEAKIPNTIHSNPTPASTQTAPEVLLVAPPTDIPPCPVYDLPSARAGNQPIKPEHKAVPELTRSKSTTQNISKKALEVSRPQPTGQPNKTRVQVRRTTSESIKTDTSDTENAIKRASSKPKTTETKDTSKRSPLKQKNH